jgi:hypothetical protein
MFTLMVNKEIDFFMIKEPHLFEWLIKKLPFFFPARKLTYPYI